MDDEKWVSIIGFPKYEISNTGGVRKASGRIIKPNYRYRKNKNGDRFPVKDTVDLSKEKNRVTMSIHRLVMFHFGSSIAPDKSHTVDHKDRNPFNNNVENLRWATPRMQSLNRAVAIRGRLKLTTKDLNDAFLRTGKETLSIIGADYGLSKSDLNRLLTHMHPDY